MADKFDDEVYSSQDLYIIVDEAELALFAPHVPVFIRQTKRPVLYSVPTNGLSTVERWQGMKNEQRPEVLVPRAPHYHTREILSDDLSVFLNRTDLPLSEQVLALYATAISAIERVLSRVDQDALVNVRRFVNVTIPFLTNTPEAMGMLGRLGAHDYSTYSHCASVYTYSIGLAAALGITEESELISLGLGALLHDAGKTRISRNILLKPGPLSPNEWFLMKRHPLIGARILRRLDDIPEVSRAIVLQHHERLDGSGYPYGLSRSQQHPFSSIVAIADVYEALTGDRPYHPARTPFEALQLIKEQVPKDLNSEAFRCLVLLLGGK